MKTTKGFEVYTYFGRSLEFFPIGNETHHKVLDEARQRLQVLENNGVNCWIRQY